MAEFSIIDQYFNRQSYTDVTLGIGDDSALITPPVNQQLVICADTLVAGRHFPLDTSAHAIGWKSVAVNLSIWGCSHWWRHDPRPSSHHYCYGHGLD